MSENIQRVRELYSDIFAESSTGQRTLRHTAIFSTVKHCFYNLYSTSAETAQSIRQPAAGWMVRGSNPGSDKRYLSSPEPFTQSI